MVAPVLHGRARRFPGRDVETGAAYGDLLEAVDLNPVAMLSQGRGAVVLDALVIPRNPSSQGPP